MIPAATREAQALACLETAAAKKEHLLAVAVKLAGSAEEGMDLYQQTCLNCHDAIQSKGFTGDRYDFYLWRALKNLHIKRQQAKYDTVAVDMQSLVSLEGEHEWRPFIPGLSKKEIEATERQLVFGAEGGVSAQEELAAQIQAEIRARFKPADRIVFRLHLLGLGCQDIAELVGQRDRTWVWRRLKRMKKYLRETFRQAFASLGD